MENMKNKNAFLITCVSCICLLLLMCYFGINSATKGTYALTSTEISTACFNQGLTYVSSVNACCPSGYTSSNSYGSVCIMSGANGPKNGTTTSGTQIEYWSINKFENDPNAIDCTEKNGNWECRYYEKDISQPASQVVEFTASFYDEDGKNPTNVTCTAVEKYGCIIQLPTAPTKDGRVFSGWTDTKGWCYNLISSNFTTYMNKEYYPCWEEQYDIKYNYNGGKGGAYSPKFGKDTSLMISNPTKTVTVTGDALSTGATVGKATSKAQTFSGWTMTGGASTAKYSSDAKTWSAWDGKTKVTVEHYRDLGALNTTVTMVANWTPVAFNLPTVTKDGYTCGWNSSSTGTTVEYASGASYTPSATSAADIKMYAVCTKNGTTPPPSSGGDTGEVKTFKGTFKNGSAVFAEKTCSTSAGGSSCTMPVPDVKPTKNGYTFTGWGTTNGCTSGSNSSFSVTANVTRYACFTEDKTSNPTPEPEKPGDGNVSENPKTGQIAIFFVWVIGLATVAYSVWYFKRLREN